MTSPVLFFDTNISRVLPLASAASITGFDHVSQSPTCSIETLTYYSMTYRAGSFQALAMSPSPGQIEVGCYRQRHKSPQAAREPALQSFSS